MKLGCKTFMLSLQMYLHTSTYLRYSYLTVAYFLYAISFGKNEFPAT